MRAAGGIGTRIRATFRTRGRDHAVFVLLVVAAYIAQLTGPPGAQPPANLPLLLGMGVCYAAIGTYGFARAERAGTLGTALAYFAVQLPFAFTLVFLGGPEGTLALVAVPLVAQSVRLLTAWGVFALSLLIVALVVALSVPDVGVRDALRAGVGVFAVISFFVVFAQIAVEEERARAEGERLAGALDAANRELRRYAVQAEELATVRECNRLAREIHDGLGHYMTVIAMQVQAARAAFDTDRERSLDVLTKAHTLTQEALADVRRSVAALRDDPLTRKSLPDALGAMVEEAREAGIETALTVTGTPRPLSPQAALTLFRAAQEGLTNVRKHARAARAWVSLDYADAACVRLSVRDDGAGATHTEGGFGLLGLRERALLLDGSLGVVTAPGEGLTLTVEVPG